MKIRNGFVSNSSSSSFVILGIKLKTKDLNDNIIKACGVLIDRKDYDSDQEYQWAISDELYSKNCKWDIICDGEIGDIYIGKIIAKGDSSGVMLEDSKHDIEDLLKLSTEIEKVFNKKTYIYTGEKSC